MSDSTEDEMTFRVVANAEEQYSIWAADRDLPAGWADAGFTGSTAGCLSHISEIWTDMRPLSVRRQLAGQ